ncbi:hypothetical protein NKI95_17090 [Mesorhizobium sp. M0306]|uniref:hypothetical protein n=1 Tax=Mesorhizobium sp. M0306 TaxID=2956932 RepID=UPI003334BBA9
MSDRAISWLAKGNSVAVAKAEQPSLKAPTSQSQPTQAELCPLHGIDLIGQPIA